jgi:rhodanese-related sulfurtransferase
MMIRIQHIIPKAFAYAGLIFMLLMAGACSRSDSPAGDLQQTDETALLLDYLEERGNLVNDPGIPNLVGADDLYGKLVGFNQLVIDLRPGNEYADGHIANSVNILPGDVLAYFEYTIDPNAFERIVMVCNNAMLSGYVAAVMRFLGYDNVFSLRNGLSSWDMGIAEKHWLAAMGSYMEGKLETTAHPKYEARSAAGHTDRPVKRLWHPEGKGSRDPAGKW